MHYCCYLITKQFPSDEVIENVLRPFSDAVVYGDDPDNEEREIKYPAFMWDWWRVGGRYCGKLKLKCDVGNDDSEYQWGVYTKESRTGRLFRSYTLEEIKKLNDDAKLRYSFSEEDYFPQMGSRDGFLYVDGGRIADMINMDEQADECYCIVDSDGNAYSREHWNGKDWIRNDSFDEQAKKIIAGSKNSYIVIVDIHD